MGLIMEEKCNIKLLKCEPGEVILVDEISQHSVSEQTEVAIKREPGCGAARFFEVMSEAQGLTDSKPIVITIKKEAEDDRKLKHENVITPKNIRIKLEPIKREEIEITIEDSSDEQDAVALYTCNICGFKTALKDTLNRHISLHVREKRYKCNECEYATSLKDVFRTHMLNHTGGKRYECDICEFTTAGRDTLNEHILQHTGEKPLKFKTKIRNIRAKPFKCNKCEYGADARMVLRKHMLTVHSGKKLLECHKCGHKTPSKSDLRQHIRIHSDRVKSYKCTACKDRFLHKSSMLRHMSQRPCKPGHS